MIKGFHFINHDPFPMIDIKFDGVSISPKKLVEFAETMRLELEKHGVVMQLYSNGKHNDKSPNQ